MLGQKIAMYINIFLFIVLILVLVSIFLRWNAVPFSVSPLSREHFVATESEQLALFYELEPGDEVVDEYPWLPKTARQTITKDGFNERFEYTVKKPKDVFRIMTLGDSFTYGMYVNTEENYSEQLEDMLNNSCRSDGQRFEVINAGVPGYDVAYTSERLKNRGAQYEPDLFVWYLNNPFHKWNEIVIHLNNECANNTPEEEYNSVQPDGSVIHTCSIQVGQELEKRKSFQDIIDYQSGYLLTTIDAIAGQWVLFADIQTHRENNELLNEVAAQNDRVYFLEDPVDIYSDTRYRIPDGHPSPAGHVKIAEDIFNYLTDNRLIACDTSGAQRYD
ncbi:MAG: SGNH/GDSL hydrolase family protein [Patescibacteria group bacterium UBA2163]